MSLDTFSVATFNLYNLQEPGKPMNRNQKAWTATEFDAKARWIAGQLELLDADVVGLQELWRTSALDKVLEAGGLSDRYDVLAKTTGGKITCGALVRKGLLDGAPEWIAKFPAAVHLESTRDGNDPQAPEIKLLIDEFSRPVLRFRVKLREDEDAVHVYVVHLKSKLPAELGREPWYDREVHAPHAKAIGAGISTIRRTAEAVAVRVLLTDEMRETPTPVIVLGDINDGQQSNTANILTEQPRYLVGDSLGGVDRGLYTAQTLQEYRDTRDVYYTHVHQDLRESLDHVLVSEQFYDNSKDRRWLFDGLIINNDHLNLDDHRATGTGDHGVVKVSFKHAPARL